MIGKLIAHYRILNELGRGGMGVVYKAGDLKLKRLVAIKFLPQQISASEEERERFKIEAQAAAALNHPNIATIHAIEEVDGDMFIVMEFIDGKELRKLLIDNGQLSINNCLNYAGQIAEGLKAAHAKGITHRDIKSSNIMVTESGQVKIMDFGLAKLANQKARFTKTGTTVGTPAYMSPEQIQGIDVDHRSDIWSFGVVLYEMLTGRLPFRGEYETAIMYAILHEEPDFPEQIPVDFQPVLQKALAKDPSKRYQSADEMAGELRAIGDKQSGRRKIVVQHTKLPWLIAAASIVVLVILGLNINFMPAAKSPKTTLQTIAVLPFLDMSPEKDQEYFSDGVAEELLNVLAKNPKLRVTSRTSAFSFKGKDTDIRTIAEKLNVKNILEGSVRKSGNQIRITAQLIDVETDAHLWSKTYDGTLDDIFRVQETISHSVAHALQTTLLDEAPPHAQRQTNPQAYNAYLQGKHFASLYTKGNWEKAIDYYEQALEIDSSYALAWTGLAFVYNVQADLGYLPLEEGYRQARHKIETALKLDPNLGVAHARMSWMRRTYDWDWRGADEYCRRALELEPGNASVIAIAASLAATLGRFEEALTLSRRSIALNPVSTVARYNFGFYAMNARLLDGAEAAFRKTLELNPRYLKAHLNLGRIYLEEGNVDSALVEMERETEPFWRAYGLLLAHHALGRDVDAELRDFIKENQDNSAFQIAEIYAYRGETNKAFEWLERAYKQRDGGLTDIKGDPLLRRLENDPRYAAFLQKMKLPL